MPEHVLITGASRGIGAAICDYFAQKGYNLSICSKQETTLNNKMQMLKSTYPEINLEGSVADFSCSQSLDTFIEGINQSPEKIDIFIANAGQLQMGLLDVSHQDLEQLFRVNVVATIAICNALAKKMKQQGSGKIFILGSNSALHPVSKAGAYASSKAAINHYAANLFELMLPYNVQITCINPSVVDTEMTGGNPDHANHDVIQTSDIVKTIDWVLNLSEAAICPVIPILCKSIELANMGLIDREEPE